MHRESILIILGVLVGIAPFSGFPLSWLRFALPLLGLLVVIIGVTLRSRRLEHDITPSHEIESA